MLTLDEAITHAKEVAKANRDKAEGYSRGEDYEQIKADECVACAEEHEQLVSWLEELKKYKAQKIMIRVKPQDAETLKKILRSSQFGIAYPETQYEVVPMVSGGQTDEERIRKYGETAEMLQIILNNSKPSFNKKGVSVENITYKGSFDWAIEQAISLLREAIL